MALLRFFDSAKAVSFGDTVAEEFCKIHALRDHNKKHQGRKPERLLALIRKTSAYTREQKLNFYARARMLAQIKEKLKAAGVDGAETEEFIRAVALERLRPSAN